MIVGLVPLGCVISDFIKVSPVSQREPFVSNSSVESLVERILLRLSWLYVYQCDASLFRPVLYDTTHVLRTIVAADNQGPASPLDDLFKGTDDPFRRQREVDLNAQGLLVVVINHD